MTARPPALKSLFRRQRSEGAVEIVVQQFVRPIGIDQKDIQVAIVIGIKKRTVPGIPVAIGEDLMAYILPTAVLCLTPVLNHRYRYPPTALH